MDSTHFWRSSRGSAQALSVEQLALLLELGLVDLALGEALIKNVEGGAAVAGAAATWAPTMDMVEAVAVVIKRIATGRPAYQPHEDDHHANDGEQHDDRADYHEGMPAPSRPAPHHVTIAVAVRRGW